MFDESIDQYAQMIMKDTAIIHLNVLRVLYDKSYKGSAEDKRNIMDAANEQYRRLSGVDCRKVSHETHADLLRQFCILRLHTETD